MTNYSEIDKNQRHGGESWTALSHLPSTREEEAEITAVINLNFKVVFFLKNDSDIYSISFLFSLEICFSVLLHIVIIVMSLCFCDETKATKQLFKFKCAIF